MEITDTGVNMKERLNMNIFKKWYFWLIVSLLAAALFTVLLIITDQRETGEVIFSTRVPGTLGETQSTSVDLQTSDLVHVLVVDPNIDSGWGEPDVYMTLDLYAPNGRVLVSVPADEMWGSPEYDNSSRSYTQKYTFNVAESGTYTIETTVLTEHVEDVSIKIGQREE
jgi:hypothetical protein